MKPPTAELRGLLDKLLDDGPLTRVQTSRMEELLHEPEALRYYTETMAAEVLLGNALGELPEVTVLPVRQQFPWWAVWLSAAACLAFVVGRWSALPEPGKTTEIRHRQAVQVTGVMGVEWEPGAGPELVAGTAVAQRLAFRSGLVELTYPDGVRVTLEGPADYSVGDGRTSTLAHGKLVSYVPPEAEGFTVTFPNGKVVDLGTEFGLDVATNGQTELGVFDGEVQLHLDGESTPRPLFINQAVIRDERADIPLRAVPLNRDKFVRRLPARDFRWTLDSLASKEIEIDVTHLVWKPASYCAIFKWIDGEDAVVISDVQLLLDGKPVATDAHEGVTGMLEHVRDNLYHLIVKPGDYSRGRWTIKTKFSPLPRTAEHSLRNPSVKSDGILQFEEGLVDHATAADFIGRWNYHFLGDSYVREFLPDGTATLTLNGVVHNSFDGSRWQVENGILRLFIPGIEKNQFHVLRDKETLIFTTNPYDNARREDASK